MYADDKIVIIPNGLVTSQFEGSSEKRKHSVGWFSSYDRGIDTFLTHLAEDSRSRT